MNMPQMLPPGFRPRPVEATARHDEHLNWMLYGFLAGAALCVQGRDARELETALAQRLAELDVRDGSTLIEGVTRVMSRMRRTPGAGLTLMASRVLALAGSFDRDPNPALNLRPLDTLLRGLLQRVVPTAPPQPEAEEESQDVWVYDVSRWRLTSPCGTSVQLSLSESRLVHCLFLNRGEVVTRDEILSVLNRPQLPMCARNLDVTVSRLRKKVDDRCRQRLPITSARGMGYLFNAPAVIKEWRSVAAA